MRRWIRALAPSCACWIGMLVGPIANAQQPLGTGFTFQGRLESSGQPATGNFDVIASLYDSPTPAVTSLLGSVTLCARAVTNGLVMLDLDFGEVFAGDASWLELGIAPAGPCDGSTVYEYLSPLLPVAPAPNSLFARQAEDATTLDGRPATDFLLRSGGTMSGTLTLSGDLCLGGVCRNSWQWVQSAAGALTYQGGNVGIGTASPVKALDVVGDIRASGLICGAAGCLGASGGDGHSLDAVDGSPTDAVFVDAVGNVGMGTLTPSQKLTVAGNVTSTGTICGSGGCAGSADWLTVTNKPTTFPPTGVRNGNFDIFGSATVRGRLDVDTDLVIGVNNSAPEPRLVLGRSGLVTMEAFLDDSAQITLKGFTNGVAEKGVLIETEPDGELTLFDGKPPLVPNTINQTVILDGRAGITGGKIIVRDGLRSTNLIEISGYDEATAGVATVRVKGGVIVEPDVGLDGFIETSDLSADAIVAQEVALTGYLQLATTTGPPSSSDCNATNERGRAKFDPTTGRLYLCANSGWIFK